MKRIRDAVLNCIYNYADDDDKLIAELSSIIDKGGKRAYSIFFNVLTQLDLDPLVAEDCWHSILAHRQNLRKKLERDINLLFAFFRAFLYDGR